MLGLVLRPQHQHLKNLTDQYHSIVDLQLSGIPQKDQQLLQAGLKHLHQMDGQHQLQLDFWMMIPQKVGSIQNRHGQTKNGIPGLTIPLLQTNQRQQTYSQVHRRLLHTTTYHIYQI